MNDVLQEWKDCIQNAHTNHSLSRGDEDVCILDLEEEVQKQREAIRELQKRVAELEAQRKARDDAETAYHAQTGL